MLPRVFSQVPQSRCGRDSSRAVTEEWLSGKGGEGSRLVGRDRVN